MLSGSRCIEHPQAVADALAAVPRSRPFGPLSELERIGVPALVVASRDEADPGHPLALAERYAAAIPDAELRVEEEGRSPIAWQGGQLSRLIAELVERSAASAGCLGDYDLGVTDPASGVGVLAAAAAGTVSFLSPCVLPLVPGYLSTVVGVSPR